MAKPMKTLQLHYLTIQFLITQNRPLELIIYLLNKNTTLNQSARVFALGKSKWSLDMGYLIILNSSVYTFFLHVRLSNYFFVRTKTVH